MRIKLHSNKMEQLIKPRIKTVKAIIILRKTIRN